MSWGQSSCLQQPQRSLFKSYACPFRYPLVIAHGHYSAEFNCGGTFSEDPPSPDRSGYDYTGQSTTHCPSSPYLPTARISSECPCFMIKTSCCHRACVSQRRSMRTTCTATGRVHRGPSKARGCCSPPSTTRRHSSTIRMPSTARPWGREFPRHSVCPLRVRTRPALRMHAATVNTAHPLS